MSKDFYTAKDIAEELKITEKSVRKLIKDGDLKAKKVCSKWIVSLENLKQFINGVSDGRA